jgi:phosphoglycolate phosphatase
LIQNIIFDWSGTLVDDLPAVWRATNYVMRQAGLAEFTLDGFRAQFRLPFAEFYSRFIPHIPLPQLEEWFHGHFREVQDSVVELPHARDFLIFCRQRGVHTFLLSSVHRHHFATQSVKTGFHDYLGRAYIEVWDKRAKIRELLVHHQLAPAETLFIGDMQHDIETARHGRIFSCGVLTGYNSLAQLRASQPDLIVEHLGELRQRLELSAFDLRASFC